MVYHHVCFGSFPVLCLLLSLIIPIVVFGAEEPPRGQILLEIEFEKIKDNQWCDLELKKSQPIGIYYVEMTSENKLPWGAWGSKQDVYADGVAWKDDQPIKKADLRLRYRIKNSWVDLIKVKPLGVINDAWFPFQLTKSLGQSFLAKESFDGVGLHTPTWNQNNSTGKLTLYAEKIAKSVDGKRQLATTWSALKALQ